MKERGSQPYVYFYRIVGCNDEREYLSKIFSLVEELKITGNYILFEKSIPVSTDSKIIDRARKLFEPVPLKDFSNGALLNLLDSKGYFSLSSDSQVNRRIKNAFGIILNLFITNEKVINLSIAVNFGTKILLWFGDYGKQISKKSPFNPKVVYWGSPKKHEIYFLILMSLIGCDVLVLNTSLRDKFDNIDKYNEFSMIIKYPNELPIGAFPAAQNTLEKMKIMTAQPKSEKKKTESTQQNELDNSFLSDPAAVVKLKRTETILEDILVPLNKRSGYIGKPYPILPAYFVRYIGVPGSSDDWEAEYYNSLYNLDRSLQMSGFYLKFMEGIAAPSAEESDMIPNRLIGYRFQNRFEIIEQILMDKILPQMHDELLDNTIRNTFVEIVNLFAEKSKNVNISIVLNFSLKIISWFNRYLPQLFPKGNLNNNAGIEAFNYEHNPKILFYGNIKAHEIFLLTAFHRLGCDVLFMHSDEDGDRPFQIFDEENTLTHLIRNKHNLPLEPFPKGERLIRKSTIAYNASKEIEEVIYSEEVGLFKPWQFESYVTQPITLKTTYDELKILWREPSKLRPEFKIQNKKVYVPNLFAKINGVSEELTAYWQDLKELSTAPNTRLMENVPFTKINYTKPELYHSNYLLDEQGLLDELKAVKSSHYKFGYLKAPLQHFLIMKINELFCSGIFLTPVDEKFKLKIIMTILTLDDEMLKLIEVFDYPQEIPKIIIYDNKKESFTENDSILLAYFNLIGLDILIFTPTNYRTIEHFIKPSLFDLYQLPQVKYDLVLPVLNNIPAALSQKPGLLSRFFKLR
ncbi:YceG family protein [Desulfosporosinus lacus]|uniref:Putative component of 'biosynthetic module n=1 Tax=Desulfosporosinus lacus DSM 15449 TaxID=1121420 RepID=A0A1M6ARY7_9FIRM|nr:YceG family protein [Desulfosporosinus lacus]SHI39187.1 Putative component of 'biosynthetic module' [Desulfosporosinus lacus DSM 15449]